MPIAEGALRNTDQQGKDAKAVEELLNTNFTGERPYDSTGEQMSATYYQAYPGAYARYTAAEQAYRREAAEPVARSREARA